ncbi:MAG TPA: hypothetical protein VEA37_02940 [Flavobacterium sp.]|nr:hypothetical protein [Flavobacterium sp.]
MPHTYIDIIPDITTATEIPSASLVEIEVWDAFIVSHSKCHSKFLREHAYDGGPCEKLQVIIGRTSYRYTGEVWANTITPFLIKNRIPVSVRVL